MTSDAVPRAKHVDHHVRHRDVTGGWLRPAVFGVMDGLVSNVALVVGVAAADASNRVVLVAGLAGLFAGAFSMATGEYNSVRSQSELAAAEIAIERRELLRAPEAEEAELAAIYRGKGLTRELSAAVARELSRDPEVAWRVHAREELGIDPDNLPSPWTAALASFVSFLLGAFVPLIPYLLGVDDGAIVIACVGGALGLFGTGVAVSRYTSRGALYTGTRQLVLGSLAAAVTYVVGSLVGVGVA
ncbi:MAG TPA: VIT1/CCC1 transporter family protein [Mycobacteriales bacterium]|nr:VIT1/CCC1 transporter family protein [Mycobacteriales bacterium]